VECLVLEKRLFCKNLLRIIPKSTYIDCDLLFFQECNENPQLFAKKLREIIKSYKGQTIIVDGNYASVKRQFWTRCDYIFYIDTHHLICMSNVIKREFWNWLNGETNEIGYPANFPKLMFLTFIKSKHSLVWHASGFDFQKQQLDNGIIQYQQESKASYEKRVYVRTERIKKDQTPKAKPKVPAEVIYLKGTFKIFN